MEGWRGDLIGDDNYAGMESSGANRGRIEGDQNQRKRRETHCWLQIKDQTNRSTHPWDASNFFPRSSTFLSFFFLFPFLFLSFSLYLCPSPLSTIQGVSKTGGINRKRVILRTIKNNKECKNKHKLCSRFRFWINQVLNSREIILHVKVNKKHRSNFTVYIFVFWENRNSTYTYIDIRSRIII